MSRPSPEQQRKFILSLMNKETLTDGKPGYLIDGDWFYQWELHVGFPQGGITSGDFSREIDNSNIQLESSHKEDPKVRVLTKGVWEKLLEWYGGGPAVPVTIVYDKSREANTFRATKSCFTVCYNGEQAEMEENPCLTIGALKKELVHWFPAVRELSLTLLDKSTKPPQVLDDEKTIGDYLTPNCFWHLESSPKPVVVSKSSNSQKHQQKQTTTNQTRSRPHSYQPSTSNHAGIVGMSNLGNTCYFNTAIQALVHTMPLVHMFLHTRWMDDLNPAATLGSGGRLPRAFGHILQQVWEGRDSYLRPEDLKYEIGKVNSKFSDYGQHDSHEVLSCMLGTMHRDLNKWRQEQGCKRVDEDAVDEVERANQAWENYMFKQDSPIARMSHGQMRDLFECPECGKSWSEFHFYSTLQLPLQGPPVQTITATFVPLDINAPLQRLIINPPTGAKQKNIKFEVSRLLGREVEVVFGCRNGGRISWRVADHSEAYIFEIGDTSKFWVPCQLSESEKAKPAMRPFVLPFDKAGVKPEQIAVAAQALLTELVSTDQDKPTETDKSEKSRLQVSMTRNWNGIALKDPDVSYMSAQWFGLIDKDRIFVDSIPPNTQEPIETIGEKHQPGSLRGPMDIDTCFDFLSTPEVFDEDVLVECPHCGKEVPCAKRTTSVWRTSDVLIIQFRRFRETSYGSQKVDTPIEYPDVLDMSKYISGDRKLQKDELIYDLYAVSAHSGSLSGGHYWCYAQVQGVDGRTEWYEFNDSSCHSISAQRAHSSQAYVLFYMRRGAEYSKLSEWPEGLARDPSLPSMEYVSDKPRYGGHGGYGRQGHQQGYTRGYGFGVY